MGRLMEISATVQNIAGAIASVLEMDVTIVDANLNRIAGTGFFKGKVEVPRHSVFDRSLKTGLSFVITEPKRDPACRDCDNLERCREKAEVCCPIILDGAVAGVIGLVTFEEDKRENLINKQKCYLNFLEKMAGMVASKLKEQRIMSELELTVNIVDLGLISINRSLNVTIFNTRAEELLYSRGELKDLKNFDFVFPEFGVKNVLQTGRGYREKSLAFYRGSRRYDLVVSAIPVIVEGKCLSVVLTLQDSLNLKRSMHKVFQKNQEYTFKDMAGRDPGFLQVLRKAREASSSDSTILISGESGTGKELLARAIHEESRRRSGLFVTVNCAAIPEALLESELFGYEEGAFTGARKGGKVGLFELAGGGTIFLDEIGDMPLYLQAKLLRVIQEKKIYRVGGTAVVDLDIRIICATNKPLHTLIKLGQFREDLYYRLNVIPLALPPLRERPEDILLLAELFIQKYNLLAQKSIRGLDRKVKQIFKEYRWPGNVRELENVIEYSVNMEKGAVISVDTVQPRLNFYHNAAAVRKGSLKEMLAQHEQEILKQYLREYGTTLEAKKRIARDLKISKTTLYRKLAAGSDTSHKRE